jgi:aminoglycoside 6'-N-acetyltransferase
MTITFKPLNKIHFPLFLKWLETPHVKRWWDQDVIWSLDLIEEKYGSYVNGYKLVDSEPKSVKAYIVYFSETPMGYVQLYDVYDFPRAQPLVGLPKPLAGIDLFIGEEDYLGKGIGPQVIQSFLKKILDKGYQHVFVDPDAANITAIKAYEKAGFKKVKENQDEVWMIKSTKGEKEVIVTSAF